MSKSDNEDDESDSLEESETSSILALQEEDNCRKIQIVLKAFDQRDENSIDVVDLGYVFRCMRVNISQAELYDIEAQLHKEDNQRILFVNLFPRLLAAVQDKKQKIINEASLELAFQSLERGDLSLTKERLSMYMSSKGEPFNNIELKDMLSHLSIRRSGLVDWRSFVKDLVESINNDKM